MRMCKNDKLCEWCKMHVPIIYKKQLSGWNKVVELGMFKTLSLCVYCTFYCILLRKKERLRVSVSERLVNYRGSLWITHILKAQDNIIKTMRWRMHVIQSPGRTFALKLCFWPWPLSPAPASWALWSQRQVSMSLPDIQPSQGSRGCNGTSARTFQHKSLRV